AYVDTVVMTTQDALGIASYHIRSTVKLAFGIDNTVVQQKAVDGFQRNAWNGLGHRALADAWRQLDGATVTTIDHEARFAIDIHQAQHIARVNQVRVFHLRVGMPDF